MYTYHTNESSTLRGPFLDMDKLWEHVKRQEPITSSIVVYKLENGQMFVRRVIWENQ